MFSDLYKKHITYDFETMMYTVWDETGAYIVGVSQYPKVAEAIMDAYTKYYLDPQFEENV